MRSASQGPLVICGTQVELESLASSQELRLRPRREGLRLQESSPEATPYLTAVRQLIDEERITAARRLLDSVPLHVANEPAIRRLRTLLAPPVVRVIAERGADRSRELDWLRTQGREHRGNWVALDGNRLLAVAPSLRALRECVKRLALAGIPVFHRVE